jgi:hypothetical protein
LCLPFLLVSLSKLLSTLCFIDPLYFSLVSISPVSMLIFIISFHLLIWNLACSVFLRTQGALGYLFEMTHFLV